MAARTTETTRARRPGADARRSPRPRRTCPADQPADQPATRLADAHRRSAFRRPDVPVLASPAPHLPGPAVAGLRHGLRPGGRDGLDPHRSRPGQRIAPAGRDQPRRPRQRGGGRRPGQGRDYRRAGPGQRHRGVRRQPAEHVRQIRLLDPVHSRPITPTRSPRPTSASASAWAPNPPAASPSTPPTTLRPSAPPSPPSPAGGRLATRSATRRSSGSMIRRASSRPGTSKSASRRRIPHAAAPSPPSSAS